jgi:hypothetical protein
MADASFFPTFAKGPVTRPDLPGLAKIESVYHKSLEQGRMLENAIGDVSYELKKAKKDLEEKVSACLRSITLGTDGQFPDSIRPAKYVVDVVKFVKEMKDFLDQINATIVSMLQCIQQLAAMLKSIQGMIQSIANALANLLNQICNWHLPALPSLPNIFGDLVWNFPGFNLKGLGFDFKLKFDFNFAFGMCQVKKPNFNSVFSNYPRSITTPNGLAFGSQVYNPPLGGTVATTGQLHDPVFIDQLHIPSPVPIFKPDYNPFVDSQLPSSSGGSSGLSGSLPNPDSIVNDYALPPGTYKDNIVSLVPGLEPMIIQSNDPLYTILPNDVTPSDHPDLSERLPSYRALFRASVTLEKIVDSSYNTNITTAWLLYMQKSRTSRKGKWIKEFQILYDKYIVPSLIYVDTIPVPYNGLDGQIISAPSHPPFIDQLLALSELDRKVELWKLSYIEASLLGYGRSTRWDSSATTDFLGFTGADLDFQKATMGSLDQNRMLSSNGKAEFPVPLDFYSGWTTELDLAITNATQMIEVNPQFRTSNPQYRFIYDQFADAREVDRYSQFWREWVANFNNLLANEDPTVLPYVLDYWEVLDSKVNPLGDNALYLYVREDALTREPTWTPGAVVLSVVKGLSSLTDSGSTPNSSNNGWVNGSLDANAFLSRPDIRVLPINTQMAMLDINQAYSNLLDFSNKATDAVNKEIDDLKALTKSVPVVGFQVHSDVDFVVLPGQSILVPFDIKDFDVTNNVITVSKFTIQQASSYTALGSFSFSGSPSSPSTRKVEVLVNGVSASTDESSNTVDPVDIGLARQFNWSQGDVVQVRVSHTGITPQSVLAGFSFSAVAVNTSSNGGNQGGNVDQGGAVEKTYPIGVSSMAIMTAFSLTSAGKIVPIHPETNTSTVPWFDGLSLAAGVANQSVSVALRYGTEYSVPGGTMTPGGVIFVGSDGVTTQDYASVVASCRWIVAVGRATSPTTFIFEPHLPIDTQGGTGPVSPDSFVYTQSTPSSLWTIVHGLNRYVATQVYDSDGQSVDHDTTYVDQNTVIIALLADSSGHAVCS